MIKLNDNEIKQNSFPDGALFFKFTEKFYPNGNIIEWNYENDRELFTLICLVNHIREGNPRAYIHLILPYIPHARMDRTKNISDIFTLKYFCQVINSLNFETVQVMDAHSNVSLALLNNVEQMDIKEHIEKVMCEVLKKGDFLVFYPDEGAMKRYSDLVEFPYAFGIKKRDWATGKIEGLDIAGSIEKIKDRNILIIDDICSRGGTFYHSAKKLKELGAKEIYLYVTHCENTIYEGELLKEDSLIKHIFTTNSLLTIPNEKMTIMEINR